MKRINIAFIPFILVAVACISVRAEEYILRGESRADGTPLLFAVAKQKIESTPAWDGTGEPPLTLSKAVSLAASHFTKKNPGLFRFHPLTISIHSLWVADGERQYWYWYYYLRMSPSLIVLRAPPSASERFTVAMLMDGTIIEPRPETKTEGANNASQGMPRSAQQP